MRRCASCFAEPGEYHLPACESRARDEAGRFLPEVVWTLPKPRPWPSLSSMRPFPGSPSMEDVLHGGGGDEEGDARGGSI